MQVYGLGRLVACVAVGFLLGGGRTRAETELPVQRDAAFFPLGVYWPGEFVWRGTNGTDWPKVDATLDLLASNHCNTIWLTHTGAGDAAEFARHAAARGIYLVASLGELAANEPSVRGANFEQLVAGTLSAWGDAPKPIAWGLGDEPRAGYMHDLAPFAAAWKQRGEPTTCVVMAGDIASAGALLDQSFLCTDIYPFFGAGDPNGPDTIAESTLYVQQGGGRARYWAQRNGIEYWFMGAVFQEPWGPHAYDEAGNIIYMPGAGPHFRMPSTAEVRWQNWAALSTGARGLIHFSLLFCMGKPGPDPASDAPEKWLPFGVKVRTNSGAPGGMLHSDGSPTAPFLAMGEDFGRIAKVAALLKTLVPCDEPVAFHAKGWIPPGDVVQVMKGGVECRVASGGPADESRNLKPETAPQYYAIVVNGNLEQAGVVAVNVQPDVVRVVDVLTGQAIPLSRNAVYEWEPIGGDFKQARVHLEPGAGTLIQLIQANKGPVTVPSVGGVPRADLPFEKLARGKHLFRYEADIQKDKGARDASQSGGFTDTGNPGSAHINGAVGETRYLFEMPGGIESIKAHAVFGNHKDGVAHTFTIAYSLDGKTFATVAEKQFPGGGDGFVVEGEQPIVGKPRSLWVSIRPDEPNGFITLKQVAVELTVGK